MAYRMKFQKAGGGLPESERLFIRLFLVPFVRVVMGWNIARVLVVREVKIIKKLLKDLSQKKLQQKMDIERTFAIEDNSRQFSVNDVLEHLVIAGKLVKDVISTLSHEKEVVYDIKIEDVKPKQNKENQLEEFLVFYDSYDNFIKNLPKKQSKTTKAHPWFVKFNNFDWNIFMFMHTFIHRRQIQAILEKQKDLHSKSNSVGTVMIAGILLLMLLVGWLLFSVFLSFVVVLIFGFEYSFIYALFVFLAIMIIRAIYPKNVFK